MATLIKNISTSTGVSDLTIRKTIFLAAAVICLFPFMSAALALLLGIIVAQLFDHPFAETNHKATNWLLKVSVVGLGFGMNLHSAIKAGKEGIWLTVISITAVLGLGYLAGKLLHIDKKTSFLISGGTAICGGSAIAALSPVIKAENKQISVALGTVFILNAVALFVFPVVGHALHLSQTQFGLWCAIAIHDTSSVVGAASKYGAVALQVATTVKLARALWIIPVTIGSSMAFKSGKGAVKIPYFIGLFLLALAINTFVPAIKPITPYITAIAKQGLVLSLFLIGSGLSMKVVRAVGAKPFIEGVALWVIISVGALWGIMTIAA